MRLLHTGDWHVGKRLYGVDRLREFTAALDHVADIAREHEVDAILMSGDIMDRRMVEPVVLSTCLQAFERLAAIAPVVAVTGNHDEPLFWAELAPYLAPRILVAASDAVFGVDTTGGRLTVACLPWPEPADAASPGVERGSSRAAYADLVSVRLDQLAAQADESRTERGGRVVLLAHLMVRGGVSGGGERELTLAGTYAVARDAFPQVFDYAALGHLHRPQQFERPSHTIRYCGSPLALDFSGEGANPSVTIVDLDDGAPARVTEVPVSGGRQLVRLRGTLDALPAMAREHEHAWFFCEVEGEPVRLDVVREVRDRIPQALRVEQIGPADAGGPTLPDAEPLARSLPEMYAQWLESVGRPADPALVAAFAAAFERAGEE